MKIRLIKDKNFYLTVLGIMLPVVAQSAINMGVNMMDTIMLGQLGEIQISASSLANSFYNTCNILCMGLAGGTSVIASHYWGAKEEEKTKQVFSMAFQLSAIMSVFFAVCVLSVNRACEAHRYGAGCNNTLVMHFRRMILPCCMLVIVNILCSISGYFFTLGIIL